MVTVGSAKTEMVVIFDSARTIATLRATVQTPSNRGSDAAASEPNAAINTMRMTGMFHFSAFLMSPAICSVIAAPSAPWPMTYSDTRPPAICPG
ncbi:Uncharacterised protein [Mycobacteroides abscessus subsp. abscessus]|nr:Uncharacterised protein [Mycobacteroides abscessus subsp. abscessus]SKV85174.1 Uncharacterised protein [Mycobacteroides abscessus subsp. abscessus]